MAVRMPLAARIVATTLITLAFLTANPTHASPTPHAAPAAGDVDDFAFDSFHADMTLTRGDDGHAELAVTETIVARFPEDADQNRGIVRAIPDDDGGVPLHTEILSVSANGSEIPFEVEENGGFVEVATGDDSFVRGVQTYVIAYSQRDTVRAFADTGADEFYRDINGTGWTQPFGEVSAYIVIDAELTDALTGNHACYFGPEGSTEQCTVVERGPAPGQPKEFFPQAYGLGPGENVTMSIGFQPGTFVPGEVERSAVQEFATAAGPAFQAGSLAALLGSLAAAIAALFARRPGRDAPGRGAIIPQYDPPREVSVVQAAHLVGRPDAAVPAAIIDLAVNANARVVSHDDATVSLEFVAPSHDPARQRMLDAVFGLTPEPGMRIRLGAASPTVASRFTAMSASAIGELRAAGLTHAQARSWPAAIFGVTVLAFIASVVCLVFAAMGGGPVWIPIAAVIVSILAGVAAAASWRLRDRVTDAGALVRDHLRGLRDYLQLAEADRIRMLQSPEGAERSGPDSAAVLHLYERLLPYAIIWGIEKEWAQVLETRMIEADAASDWFEGVQGFSGAQLVGVLAASRAAATPASAWASSGGSSFSGGSLGGGFSGGGAGGGGGGGR